MNFDTRGLKVMVAEHDRAVLEMLQIRLDVAGYHTCMARNGIMALETLKTFRPSALLIDLRLPELNGFEVLKLMNPRGAKLRYPVLVMARDLDADDIRQAMALGASDCIAKPFSGAEVLERLTRLLRRPVPPPRPRRLLYV